jgi:light-regulated signal transduction histidine kinase (bacteriophytochrome)
MGGNRFGIASKLLAVCLGFGLPIVVMFVLMTRAKLTDIEKGTGQGLAVGHAVVQRHGGTLTFESTAGRGTTFSMRLPVEGPAGGGATA